MLLQKDYLVPLDILQDLPFAVSHQLQELPDVVQADFVKKYKKASKSIAIAYFLHFFFPLHYFYLGKFITQLIYWVTFGGMGFWWVLDIFRIPELIKTHNDRVADRCLREVMYKHRRLIEKHTPRSNTAAPQIQARNIQIELDPTRIDLGNLEVGYFLDFGLKTWEIRAETQYDWQNGQSDKEFKMVSGTETQLLCVNYEGRITGSWMGNSVSMFSIQENLDQEILQRSSPPNILQYGDLKFYKEQHKDGLMFKKVPQPQGIKVLAWDYMDGNRKYMLRIEQTGRNNFRTTLWHSIDPYSITDILPK